MAAVRFCLKLLFVVILFLGGCASMDNKKAVSNKSGQQAKSMARPVNLEIEYLLYLPKGYDKDEKSWPLMVFLHGAGERGDNLDKVKFHGPPKLVDQGKDLPFIIISPQCPEGKWWPGFGEHVRALIEETVENYRVDESRIYLTGLSMGGYGTWSIASIYPERFAAIAPVCGGGSRSMGRRLKDVPIWAFHGAKDNVVPLQKSQEMVDAVNKAGGNAKLTVYPEAGHDSWTETYNNKKLYEWLLSHSKKQD